MYECVQSRASREQPRFVSRSGFRLVIAPAEEDFHEVDEFSRYENARPCLAELRHTSEYSRAQSRNF